MQRPAWISRETSALLDLLEDAAASAALVHTDDNRLRLRQAEADFFDAIRTDVLREVVASTSEVRP